MACYDTGDDLPVDDYSALLREICRLLQRGADNLRRNRRRVVAQHDFDAARRAAEILFEPGKHDILSTIHFARHIMTTCPNASLGYLNYTRILEERGQYAAAVRIYDKALQRIRRDDPYFKRLQSRRHELVSEVLNLRPLGKLPVEIIDYLMLNFLSVTDRVRCAQTCKAWKHLVLDSKVMWQDIDFRRLTLRMLNTQLYDKSLRKVTIGYSPTYSQLCPLGIFIPGRLDYIEELEIDLEPLYNLYYYPITSRLLDILALNRQSLTSIRISCEDDYLIPTFLNNCPNLTHLCWRIFDWVQASEANIPWPRTIEGPWKLKHLSIHVPDLRFLSPDTLQLISDSPELETLYLFIPRILTPSELYDRGALLQTLNQHCRQLRRVDFAHETWQNRNSLETVPCSINNVQYASPRTADVAFPLILRLASNLETLGLPVSYLSTEQWIIINNMGGFPQLRTLNLWWDDLDVQYLPAAFQALSNSQALETVRIHRSRMVDDIVFAFLQTLHHLHCLEFYGSLNFGIDALHAYVSSSSCSSLRYLTICNRPSDRQILEDRNNYEDWQPLDLYQVLPILASLPDLRHLNIESMTGTMDEQTAAAFLTAVRSVKLSRIKLKMRITFECLCQLASLQSLTYLHLEFYESFVEQAIFSQVQKFQDILLQNSLRLRRIIMKRLDEHPCIKFIDI